MNNGRGNKKIVICNFIPVISLIEISLGLRLIHLEEISLQQIFLSFID